MVAHRFARSRRRARGVGPVTLAIVAIAAGVLTLNVVLAVMNGFQSGTIDSLLEVSSFHVRVQAQMDLQTFLNDPAASQRFATLSERVSHLPGVAVATPFVEIQTLGRGQWPDPVGVLVRAVDPAWLTMDGGAADVVRIVAGGFDLEEPGTVVLGAELARRLGVGVGETVGLLHIVGGGSSPREAELRVTGTFRTGNLDIDMNGAYISLSSAGTALASRDRLELGVKFRNRYNDSAMVSRIAEAAADAQVEATVRGWREFNRGIFGALRLEKAMMTLLVGLIFVVVGTNIAQLQRRRIVERSEEIAILQAVGAGASSVHTVFILESALIGLIGASIGTALGLAMALRIDLVFAAAEAVATAFTSVSAFFSGGTPRSVRIFSPDYFYISGIPTRLFWYEVAGTAGAALASAVGAGIAASVRATRVTPATLLRNE